MASPGVSSDEGEIIEATPLPRSEENGEVDRTGRHRPIQSPFPDDDGRSRQQRSQSPRGWKRSRDDRDGRDTRQFRVHYEEGSREKRRHGRDLDRPSSRGSFVHHDERANYYSGGRALLPPRAPASRQDGRHRDRGYARNPDDFPDQQTRIRSRSPRGHRDGQKRERGGLAESYKYSAQVDRGSQHDPRSKRAIPVEGSPKQDTKSRQGATVERGIDGLAISQSSATTSQHPQGDSEPDLDWDESTTVDQEAAVEAEIQRRRLAREAAYKRGVGAVTPTIQALQARETLASPTPDSTRQNTPGLLKTEVNTPLSTGRSPVDFSLAGQQDAMSPSLLNFVDDQDLVKAHGNTKNDDQDGPSAADYDPTVDMEEDERRDEMRHGNVGLHGETRLSPPPENFVTVAEEDDNNDDFDMFAEDFDEKKFAPAPLSNAALAQESSALQPNAGGGGILEGDDKLGYYKIRPGEILDGRYQISTTLGRGMFSGVARATDLTSNKAVAIKIMRKNDALRKGGFTEIAILQKLNAADPGDKGHIVKFERSFEYRGHLCMAFENLSLNLREVLKKFGNNIGISLVATRAFARQIFIALVHMRKCSIIHADLKPDNILVNETRNWLKICDLGTAIDRSDAATASTEITPYLVSRFYRAPEIILGMPYDYAVDVWSIGCTLFELYTGKILFTGDSNNQMLRNIMEIRGKLSPKLYRRGQLAHLHFDDVGNFLSVERDKIQGKVRHSPPGSWLPRAEPFANLSNHRWSNNIRSAWSGWWLVIS
ncbi:kinase-like domain-containing protein [Lasiosphaeria miniovina]|uniref:Kinase-like domain-containing protein n=1 Tax=Lasiosphaeria miniovina TaxID=1954250 RepID=A0AA40AL73_9PEZI|nr:kinase-like domain-containing protein [Lasiosphaeria miniovina]KAK0717910.1 kinase-like domain-containing protein [Lasiosphaeria miniovina]